MLTAAQSIYSHLTQEEAIQKIANSPYLNYLLKPSPLEGNNVVSILDRENDELITSYDWVKVHEEETQKLEEQIAKIKESGQSTLLDEQWDELLNVTKGLTAVGEHGRHLEVATAVAVGTALLPLAVEGIREFIGFIVQADKDMSDYTKICDTMNELNNKYNSRSDI